MVQDSLSTAVVNKEFGLILIHRFYSALFFEIAGTCMTDIRVVVVVVVVLNKIWAELSAVRGINIL